MHRTAGAVLDPSVANFAYRETRYTTKPAVAQWECGGLSIPIGSRFESGQRVQITEGAIYG